MHGLELLVFIPAVGLILDLAVIRPGALGIDCIGGFLELGPRLPIKPDTRLDGPCTGGVRGPCAPLGPPVTGFLRNALVPGPFTTLFLGLPRRASRSWLPASCDSILSARRRSTLAS